MPLLRTPSKGDHDKGNGHDFFDLLFFALSCRQKISRKDAVAPSINFQKCGRTEDRRTEKFFWGSLIEHLAARAGKPDTLMPREVKNSSPSAVSQKVWPRVSDFGFSLDFQK